MAHAHENTGTSTHQVLWDETFNNAANSLHLGMAIVWPIRGPKYLIKSAV